MAVQAFKEIYSGSNRDLAQAFIAHNHHQEGIPTCVQYLRNLKTKIESEVVDIETYD